MAVAPQTKTNAQTRASWNKQTRACAAWNTHRRRFCDSAGAATNAHSKDEFARLVLSCVPGQTAFPVVAQWFDQVDRSSSEV